MYQSSPLATPYVDSTGVLHYKEEMFITGVTAQLWTQKADGGGVADCLIDSCSLWKKNVSAVWVQGSIYLSVEGWSGFKEAVNIGCNN